MVRPPVPVFESVPPLTVSWAVPVLPNALLAPTPIDPALTMNSPWKPVLPAVSDCAPAPFRVTPIGLQMLVHGRWIAVPSNKIQYRLLAGDTGDTGGGHWCGAFDVLQDSTECAI